MMYFKTLVVFVGWVLFYYLGMMKVVIFNFTQHFQGYLLCAALFGYFHSHLGISISHDGCHGAYDIYQFLH